MYEKTGFHTALPGSKLAFSVDPILALREGKFLLLVSVLFLIKVDIFVGGSKSHRILLCRIQLGVAGM